MFSERGKGRQRDGGQHRTSPHEITYVGCFALLPIAAIW